MNQIWDETPWSSGHTLAGICTAAIERAESLRSAIKRSDAPEANQPLRSFNEMLVALDTASGLASLMFQVHPAEPVRHAARECQQRVAELESTIYLDRGLFDALNNQPAAGLEPQGQRALSKLLRDFRRSGVDKDDSTRARLSELNAEMVKLGQQYQEHVRNDVRTVRVPEEALEGLPDDFKRAHLPGEDGLVAINTDYPDFIPFQTYSPHEPSRRALYLAFLDRAYPQNESLLKELLNHRREYATLLGFSTWAEYFAADKMVKTAARIEQFIAELNEAAGTALKRDTEQLLRLKRREAPGATAIEMWDRFYWVAKAREEKHAFDARSVRPYFSYPRVKQGILDLYGELFGLTFERLADAPVWHPSVEAYALHADGQLIGHFFLDMHPREGKFKHAAMFPVQTGLRSQSGGAARLPVASLVCNFADPSVGDGHALMEHSDVVTYFHEFGHLIHHLLASGTSWLPLSGLSVEWDFVETPSQLLEEWAWDARVLQRFAKHIDTGEALPAESVARMRAAEELGKGLHIQRQLYYTAFSYFMHAADPASLDFEAFTAEMAARYSPFPVPAGARLYANFGHLIGYTSAYYTYQWSLVMAKDLFTRFEREGLLNPTVAESYRRSVLEPGATKDAADLVQDFLGRPYSTDAYRAWLAKE